MSQYLTRSVTRIRETVTGTDVYGNDTTSETSTVIPNCSWDPRSSLGSENTNAQQQVVSGLMLLCADPAVDIVPTDAIVVEGVRYEVDGEVGRTTGSLLGNDHAAVALRRVTG